MNKRRIRFDIRQSARPILIGVGIWLALGLAFWFLMLQPKLEEHRALVDDSGPVRQALEVRRNQVEAVEDYSESLEQAERDLHELRDALSVRDLRAVAVQSEVETICREFGIGWDSINIENESMRAQAMERMAMIVPLTGGYSNLRKFIQAVEGSDEFLVVEQVSLGESADGSQQLILNITLTTYFEAPEALRQETRKPQGVDESAARRA
ncbi:MAG: type 4a pilus biogenesis protein PilO [Acidobacteriota bacterium]|nr:type 4a pilus biogenesis protein PilO [Acidobacteriota bacterium]MDH3783860.1 type 4a pilus biogenesis protein PilO [Acidobacteriota bacterium]